MKTSKMMKIINKTIKNGKTILSQEDVKKLFGEITEETLEKLKQLDCDVDMTAGTYIVRLTRVFDNEEIKREELLESFADF